MSVQILIVDDEPLILSLLRTALTGEGFEVLTASTYGEAIEVFNANPFIDLVLLDRQLPDGDGVQALREVRQIRPDVPCWFVTGHASACGVADILNEGADYVFGKPFDLRKLIDKVCDTVGPAKSLGETALSFKL